MKSFAILLLSTSLALAQSGQAVGPTISAIGLSGARPTTVIGSLPTCNAANRGLIYLVTDALLPAALATVGAGGAVIVGVTCTGAAWIVQ